jgi:hypothetical protein
MNPLEARKQLLIAESELNRARLIGDVAVLTAAARRLTCRATTWGTIASSAAVLAASLAAIHGGRTAAAGAKPSHAHAILDGAVLISFLCLSLYAQRSDPGDP